MEILDDIIEATDNTDEKEIKGQKKENPDMKNVTEEVKETIEVDPQTGEVVIDETTNQAFKKTFDSRKEVNDMADLLEGLGYGDNYDIEDKGKSIVIKGVTEYDLDVIQRKCNIKLWSDRTQAAAKAVTHFATDVADYALNGALAPTAGAVIDAGLTTGRVVGTAALTVGAATVATTIRNGRAAAKELRHNKDVKDAWSEVKALGSDLGGFLFGGNSSKDKKSSWTAC